MHSKDVNSLFSYIYEGIRCRSFLNGERHKEQEVCIHTLPIDQLWAINLITLCTFCRLNLEQMSVEQLSMQNQQLRHCKCSVLNALIHTETSSHLGLRSPRMRVLKQRTTKFSIKN